MSLLDGVPSVREIVAFAQALSLPAAALTDSNALYGAMEFASECRQAGIASILGAELTLARGLAIVLLAQNMMGSESKRGLPQPSEVQAFRQANKLSDLAGALNCGEPTLADIFDQLARPGRDPRDDAPPPLLRSDVLKLEDLKTGMRLKGTVRNVVDFGAFVDIGVKHDGLLHKSKLPRGTTLSVGDVIGVTVLAIDLERERISLGLAENPN